MYQHEPHEEEQDDFSLKQLFLPLTPYKAITIFVFVGFLVFANMLFNSFVWDDIAYITKNPGVHQLDIPSLFGPNMFNSGPFYRPIPAVYFATIYSLFGANTFFFHLFQLLLHLVSTSLLFIFFRMFFKPAISFFLALIFLVHPIQVESVSYIESVIVSHL